MKRFCKIIFLLFFIVSCKTQERVLSYNDPVKDLPKEINERFVIPRIKSKETAVEICRLIIKDHNERINVKELIVEKATLISNDRVWEIVLKTPNSGLCCIYNIRINKNTGEILNFWVVK